LDIHWAGAVRMQLEPDRPVLLNAHHPDANTPPGSQRRFCLRTLRIVAEVDSSDSAAWHVFFDADHFGDCYLQVGVTEPQFHLIARDLNSRERLVAERLQDCGAPTSLFVNPLALQSERIAVSVVEMLANEKVWSPTAESERVSLDCIYPVDPMDVGGIGAVATKLATNAQTASAETAADHDAPFLVVADGRSHRTSVHVFEQEPGQSISLDADHAAQLLPDDKARRAA
jgi:hypothetical protein